MNRLLCFGMGYTARALEARLAVQGWTIDGTSRTAGTGMQQFNRDHPLNPSAFAGLSHILVSIPPDDIGDPVLDAHGDEIAALAPSPAGAGEMELKALPLDGGGLGGGNVRRSASLQAASSPPPLPSPIEGEGVGVPDALALPAGERGLGQGRLEWLGYLSTTGVYGDRGGDWVDERSELRPSGARGRRRVAAERGWLDLWRRRGVPVHIFRLAGIYGPGRSAFDALRGGTAKRVDKQGQVFSRIHVDDIASVLLASMAKPRPGAIYNVCDDEPAAPAEVVADAAAALDVPAPPLVPFDEAALSPMARSFWADNKRVSNALIKRELGVRLRYPSYREGLAAILAAGG